MSCANDSLENPFLVLWIGFTCVLFFFSLSFFLHCFCVLVKQCCVDGWFIPLLHSKEVFERIGWRPWCSNCSGSKWFIPWFLFFSLSFFSTLFLCVILQVKGEFLVIVKMTCILFFLLFSTFVLSLHFFTFHKYHFSNCTISFTLVYCHPSTKRRELNPTVTRGYDFQLGGLFVL